MRSDKYKNREIRTSLSDDSWEETQLLFQNRDREKDALRRREEYEVRREKDALYQEYLAMRKNPEGSRSPEHDLRSRSPQRSVDDAYADYRSVTDERAAKNREENRRKREAAQMNDPNRNRHEARHNSQFERDRQAALARMEQREAYANDEYAKERIKKKEPILNQQPDRYEKKEQRQSNAKKRREYEEYQRIRQEEAKAQGKHKAKKRKAKDRDGGGSRKKGGFKHVLAIILLLIAVVAVGGFLFMNSMMTKVGDLDLDKSNLGIDPAVSEQLSGYRNIALLGVDARDMSDYDNCRTDAIIIMSIDNENKEIRQISVYRDTYLYIDEQYGYNKITNVHSNAGTEATIRTLNQNMDLNIEEVALINWKVVADTVDGLGGIEVDVLESEISEMNKYIPDTAANIGGPADLIMQPGLQTLNGNQAVTYARIRKDSAQGDYRRNERMKIVLSATIDKAKRTNPIKLNKIANTVLPQIKTNMSNNDMMSVMLSLVTKDMTGSAGWPFAVTGWSHGAWYGVPDTLQSNVIQLHEQYFGQPGYTVTDTVEEISKNISYKTGIY